MRGLGWVPIPVTCCHNPVVRVRELIVAAILTVIFLPAAVTSSRQLVTRARFAASLAPLPKAERQRAVYGPAYGMAEEIRRRAGDSDAVDFVMLTPEARDLAVFTGALVAPRPVRFFLGEDAWRRRERATFFHDARAANAPPGAPPGRAAVVVLVDPRATPPMRVR